MNAEGIWKLFCETGNVSCYLMYKEMARKGQRAENVQEQKDFKQTENRLS